MIKDLILEVNKGEANFSKKSPETLEIIAFGNDVSSDCASPRLVRRIYVNFPHDGIQEYDFFIDKPDEPATGEIISFSATCTWIGCPKELKGIMIISKTNKLLVGVQP